jgi:two-component system response regulator AtoC
VIDRILIVDDEFLIRQLLEETAGRQGLDVRTAASGEEAIEILETESFQMAFVDLKMGAKSGMDVLRFSRQRCPEMLFVIMTAYGTVETAIEAIRIGAFDFIIKPFSPDQMDILVEKGRMWCQLNAREMHLRHELNESREGFELRTIGSSSCMRDVARLIERVAGTDATVLITGESGTGKELVASEIESLSNPDGKRPYIRMNCAAVPESLLESELFGHEKGAFTGASDRRVGRFELADGGTLLLDEIGEINTAMQSKLLRVLQESEFERVGGAKTIKVRVRVIATTNRDLRKEVAAGRFREDLYYRLNVFPIHLPPLRERGSDSVEIANHFLKRQERKLHRPFKLTADAVKLFTSYPWPGNIRELENVIERITILEDGPEINASAFPPDMRGGATGSLMAPSGKSEDGEIGDTLNLAEIEKKIILKALRKTAGNKTRAADLLGFSVRTLRNKLNEFAASAPPDDEIRTVL